MRLCARPHALALSLQSIKWLRLVTQSLDCITQNDQNTLEDRVDQRGRGEEPEVYTHKT